MVQLKVRFLEESLTKELRKIYQRSLIRVLELTQVRKVVTAQRKPTNNELDDIFAIVVQSAKNPIRIEVPKAYNKGITFAKVYLAKKKVSVVEFIPELERLNLEQLELRALEMIANLNDDLKKQILRITEDSISKGHSPEILASRLKNLYMTLPESEKQNFMRLGRHMKIMDRMEKIARTIIIEAHTEGSLRTYKLSGIVEGIEWLTADDERVCPICAPLNGKKFKMENIQKPPIHPQCRCAVVPILFSDENKIWTEPKVVEL